ncbi:MAG: hypothetical protein HZB26_21045 [Candidatus Hydrogenedentes bacterium]|nr:hypothetical protein [Candidatus Hydrogenedentota bacterium]
MNRQILIVWICAASVFALALVYGFVRNPAAAHSAWLTQRLEDTTVLPVDTGPAELDIARLPKAIAAKPNLWQDLVATPPPVAAAPDLKKMLEGVTATRQQVGEKVKLISNAKKSSEYVAQGDTYNGLVVKSITVKEVIFSLIQASQEYTLGLPRE